MGSRYTYASYSRPLSVEKTKWELYLEELGLEDEAVMHALRYGTGAAAGIRAWVRANCMRTFIPESVLGTLGIEVVLADLSVKIKEEEIW